MSKVDERFKQLLMELIKMTDEELERFIDFIKMENSIIESTKKILIKIIEAIKETRRE